MPISNSYKQAECCYQQDCCMLDVNDEEPCWGQVYLVDEEYTEDDSWLVHTCEGHENHPKSYVVEKNGV